MKSRLLRSLQGCRERVLADQLTLSQPGGHIIPTSLLRALPDIQTLRRHCVVCSQTRTVPRFESELRSINIEDDMNKHLHNTYIVTNLLLYVLEYEQVYKDETKIIRLNEKALTYYLVNQSST